MSVYLNGANDFCRGVVFTAGSALYRAAILHLLTYLLSGNLLQKLVGFVPVKHERDQSQLGKLRQRAATITVTNFASGNSAFNRLKWAKLEY